MTLMSLRLVLQMVGWLNARQLAVSRFVLVLGVGLGLNLLLMHGFVDRLHWPYLFAQMLTTGIVLFWHFAGHALWSFAHRDGAPG